MFYSQAILQVFDKNGSSWTFLSLEAATMIPFGDAYCLHCHVLSMATWLVSITASFVVNRVFLTSSAALNIMCPSTTSSIALRPFLIHCWEAFWCHWLWYNLALSNLNNITVWTFIQLLFWGFTNYQIWSCITFMLSSLALRTRESRNPNNTLFFFSLIVACSCNCSGNCGITAICTSSNHWFQQISKMLQRYQTSIFSCSISS